MCLPNRSEPALYAVILTAKGRKDLDEARVERAVSVLAALEPDSEKA